MPTRKKRVPHEPHGISRAALLESEPALTRREQEALNYVRSLGSDGCGVWDLAGARDISYPAAYSLLESLKDKGAIEERWASKGHKKSYKLAR